MTGVQTCALPISVAEAIVVEVVAAITTEAAEATAPVTVAVLYAEATAAVAAVASSLHLLG